MSKRKPKTDTSRFSDLSDLDQSAAEITGKEKSKTFSLADTREPEPTDPKLNRKGRVKFTTTIKPELRELLQKAADNNAINISDVLETVIKEYFEIK